MRIGDRITGFRGSTLAESPRTLRIARDSEPSWPAWRSEQSTDEASVAASGDFGVEEGSAVRTAELPEAEALLAVGGRAGRADGAVPDRRTRLPVLVGPAEYRVAVGASRVLGAVGDAHPDGGAESPVGRREVADVAGLAARGRGQSLRASAFSGRGRRPGYLAVVVDGDGVIRSADIAMTAGTTRDGGNYTVDFDRSAVGGDVTVTRPSWYDTALESTVDVGVEASAVDGTAIEVTNTGSDPIASGRTMSLVRDGVVTAGYVQLEQSLAPGETVYLYKTDADGRFRVSETPPSDAVTLDGTYRLELRADNSLVAAESTVTFD